MSESRDDAARRQEALGDESGEPRLVGGRYRLGPMIGRGGMATIHRARDLKAERDVAVKLLHHEVGQDVDLAQRFRREALAATVLRHPNIVACLDTGTDDGQPYLVMELIDGEDLAARLRRSGCLAPDHAARIGLDVARGLGVAHVRGIVHRDIKPGNILLAADGRAMVADFGIARLAVDAEAALPGTTLGSVHYFSPEQARGVTTTPASDVYGLGLVLYEALTGRRAWTGPDPDSIALARLGAPAPSPRALVPEVPEKLDAVVRRALAPDAVDRYENGFAMAGALESMVTSIPAVPPAVPAAATPPMETFATAAPIAPPAANPPLRPPPIEHPPVGPAAMARPSDRLPSRRSIQRRTTRGLAVVGLGVAGVVLGVALVAALPGGDADGRSGGLTALAAPRPTRSPAPATNPTNADHATAEPDPTGPPAATSTIEPATPIAQPRTPPPGRVADLCEPYFGFSCGLEPRRYAPSSFRPAFDIKLGTGWSNAPRVADVVSLVRDTGRMVFVSGIREVYPSGHAVEPRDRARDLIEAFVVTEGISSTKPAKVKIGGEKGFSVDLAPLDDESIRLFDTAEHGYALQPRRVTRLVAVDVDGRAIVFAIEPADGSDLRALLDTADDAAATIRWR